MKNTSPSGFTLIELLVALAVGAVLLGIGAPSIGTLVQNQRMERALGDATRAAFYARSESAKSGDSVTVCARDTDEQCGTDWNNGLLVFRDSTIVRTETTAVRDTDDEILRIVAAHGHDVELSAMASTDRTSNTAYTPAFVRYEPDGRSNWKNGTIYVCDDRGTTHVAAAHITISGDIRPARRPKGASDSNMKDVFGRFLSCSDGDGGSPDGGTDGSDGDTA